MQITKYEVSVSMKDLKATTDSEIDFQEQWDKTIF
jgi:hypothetical protein